MSVEFTDYILNLPCDRQNRHWSGSRPWTFQNVNVRLPATDRLTNRDVTVNSTGAVVRIKRMVERPCFGSPIAFLTHGGERYGIGRNGKPFPFRCNLTRCGAAEACAYVARRRLQADDEIREARDIFEQAGGIRELNRQRDEKTWGRASSAWGALLRALNRHGAFPCKNTDMLREHVATHLAEARHKDAKRKQGERLSERKARILAGADDQLFLDELHRWCQSDASKLIGAEA